MGARAIRSQSAAGSDAKASSSKADPACKRMEPEALRRLRLVGCEPSAEAIVRGVQAGLFELPARGLGAALGAQVRACTRKVRVRLSGRAADVLMKGLGGVVGGGGGAEQELEGRRPSYQPKNETVYLTFATLDECVATKDPFDRAHRQFGPDGLLLPAVRKIGASGRYGSPLAGSRPRRYPLHQMTSRGVAFDSAFDRTYEIQAELDGIAGVGRSSVRTVASLVQERLERIGPEAVRARLRWTGRQEEEAERG